MEYYLSLAGSHPFFIQPVNHGSITSPQSHLNINFSSSILGAPQGKGGSVGPISSTCSTGRLIGYPASISYAPVSGHQGPTSFNSPASAVSPYSVNSFTSQPHLLNQVSITELLIKIIGVV